MNPIHVSIDATPDIIVTVIDDDTLDVSVVIGEVLNINYAGNDLAYTASVPISGGRLVRMTATGLAYYDAATVNDAYSLLGISLNGGNVSDSINVGTSGVIQHDGLGLLPGEYYLAGANGTLTRSVTGLIFQQIIGQAITANSINFQPQTITFPLI